MRNIKPALLAIFLWALAGFALPGFAGSQARIVRLSYVEGEVQIDRRAGQGFERAILNMPVTQGVTVKTGADGRAEVEFEDGTTVRLAPESFVTFPQLSLRSSGAKLSSAEVQEGTAYFDVRQKGEDEFTLQVAHREIELPRTAHFRVDVGRSEATVALFKGKLAVRSAAGPVEIKSGETLTLDLNDNGHYLLAKGTEPDRYDDWDKTRAQYVTQYSSAQEYNSYPYYGRSDLASYGSFYYHPGYGNLWRPYGTPTGWDPFYDGAWVWYPGFGYTWVSYYPWGWLPYRYGSWMYVPGWGWGWQPGSYLNTWTWTPRIYNRPQNYVQPTPPPVKPTGNPTVYIGNPRRTRPPNRRLENTLPGGDSDALVPGRRSPVVVAPTPTPPPTPPPQPPPTPPARRVDAPRHVTPTAPPPPPPPPRRVAPEAPPVAPPPTPPRRVAPEAPPPAPSSPPARIERPAPAERGNPRVSPQANFAPSHGGGSRGEAARGNALGRRDK